MKKLTALLVISFSLSYGDSSDIDLGGFVSVPVGDFASSTDGMAETRFGASLGYFKRVSPTLSVGSEVSFIMNTLDRRAFGDLLIEQGASDVSVGGGTYFNFPIMGVVNLSVDPLSKSGITIHAGAGIDFMRMMDMDLEIDGESGTVVFDPGSAFAWSLGGTLENGTLLLGFRYMNLGEHTIHGEVINSSGDSADFSGTQQVSIVTFLVGKRF